MQSVSFKIWTRVAVSISYYNNRYTMGTSLNHILHNSDSMFMWHFTYLKQKEYAASQVFCLFVSLFNGISTFVGYLMPKPPF